MAFISAVVQSSNLDRQEGLFFNSLETGGGRARPPASLPSSNLRPPSRSRLERLFGTRSITALNSHLPTLSDTTPNLHGAITVRFPTSPNTSTFPWRTYIRSNTFGMRALQQDATLR
jgi:hypothetical protein